MLHVARMGNPLRIGGFLLSAALMAAACGGSTEVVGGSAGAAGSGGSAGTAGIPGSGGATGLGGSAGTGGTAATGGSAGTAGFGGTGGGLHQSGDCTPGSADEVCPPDGSQCTELLPGGFRVCTLPAAEATQCTGQGFDMCCNSSECSEGACYSNNVIPGHGCGGAEPVDMNVCAVDQCQNDQDCQQGGGSQICVPRGVQGSPIRFCMVAACRTDADCTAAPGGQCAPVANPCCGNSWMGLFCVYPGTGCRTSADCQQQNCTVDYQKGESVCSDEPIACPA